MLFGIEELNNLVRIKNELDRVANTLQCSSGLTQNQYRELYVVQQTLNWFFDPDQYASPFDLIEEMGFIETFIPIKKEECKNSN
jgi:hypothetical protein